MTPYLAYKTALPVRRAAAAELRSGNWLAGLIIGQMVCQLAMLSSQTGQLRVPFRIAAFGMSVALLVAFRGKARPHPSATPAIIVILIMAAEFFHPYTNNAISGVAQICLYVAILAPLFWVPQLHVATRSLIRVLMLLWLFHTVSASVGILQVYFPGFAQPPLSVATAEQGDWYVEDLKITTASGAHVFRPMGLTDVPGGAAMAGFYAVLFGVGFFLMDGRWLVRAGAVSSMVAGVACICLSMSRSVLVMLGFCVAALCLLLLFRGQTKRVMALSVTLTVVVLVSFSLAILVGGESVRRRLNSLTAAEPGEVYQANRGRFLDHTINDLLPEYPLGAGLGRWGMINTYFADNSDPKRNMVWAEIMWTGWLLDGGVPLIVAYLAALAIAFHSAWKIMMRSDKEGLWLWAAVMTAYNLGALVMTFSYPFFVGQAGLELWMLNAALFAASRHAR